MKASTFENMLKNYYDYKICTRKLKDDIDCIWYELSGVKAIRYDKQPTTFNSNLNEIRKLDLLDELESKQIELEMINTQISFIERKLEMMNEDDKKLVLKIICDKESYEKVGREVGYSHNGMWKKLKRDIESIL